MPHAVGMSTLSCGSRPASCNPRRPQSPRRWQHLRTALCAALIAAPALSRAQTDYWQGGDGDWDVGANWSLGLPKSAYDVVNDTSGSITYDTGTNTVNSFLNMLSGDFDLSGGTLKTTTSFQNTGSGNLNLSAGTLDVGSDFVNSSSGAVNLSGATVNVTGSFTNSGTGIVTISDGTTTVKGNVLSEGAFNLNGGMLIGTSASASSLEVDNSFIIAGGTLQNFTVNPGSGGQGVVFAGSSDLSGVVMNAAMDIGVTNNSAIASIYKNLTLNNTATVDNSGILVFSDTSANQTLGSSTGKTGTVTLGVAGTGYLDVEDGVNLKIGSGITIDGASGSIGGHYATSYSVGNSLTNAGVISANSGVLSIVADTFTNTGTLSASNGSNLYLYSATTKLNGKLSADTTSAIMANSITINNANSAFTVTSGALTLNSATLQNATVNVSGTGTGLAFTDSYNTLDNVTVNTNLNLNNSSYTFAPDALAVSGTLNVGNSSSGYLVYSNATANSTTGIARIVLGGATSATGGYGVIEQTDGNTLTISSGTTVTGYDGSLGQLYSGSSDTLINQGTINSNVDGGSLSIYDTNFTSTGALTATNGGSLILQAGTSNLTGSMKATGAGSTIYLYDTVNVSNGFVFNSTDGGNIYINGTLDGGGNAFTVASGALTLNSGTLQNATVNISGTGTGIAMQGGTLLNDTLNETLNITSGGNTLDNVTVNGDLNIVNSNYNYVPDSLAVSGTLNLGNGGYGYLVFSNATANNTTGIANIVLGGATYTDSYYGFIYQTGGNTLTISPGTTIHGSYGFIGDLASGSSDTLINQGTINSDVSNGRLYIDATNFTNSGTLSATNGGTLTLNSATTKFTGGQVQVDSISSLNAAGSITQTGGTTTVDGSFSTPSNKNLYLQGGSLSGAGTITGNVDNTGGTVKPGDLLGTLTVNGNYTQSTNGTTEIDLGGTQQGVSYDLLAVTDKASLGGALDVKLANGFTPTVGETFDFLTYGSRSGAYSNLFSLDPGFSYSVTYNNSKDMGILTVTAAGVPESSTLMTAGLMLSAGGLLLRRARWR